MKAVKAETTGEGEPIVLVPGGLTGWISWIPHAKRLADRYKVIRTQLHSVDYGLRHKPLPKDYSMAYELEALKKCFDEQGIESAHAAGWSYGGGILLSFALHNPERIKTLTLVEPEVLWVLKKVGQDHPEEIARMQKQYRQFGPDDVSEDQLISFIHAAGFVPIDTDPRQLPQWPVWYKHRRSLLMRDAVFTHNDDPELLATFNKPALLIKGTDATSLDKQVVDTLGRLLPTAKVKELPGDHSSHISSIDEFMWHFEQLLASQNHT